MEKRKSLPLVFLMMLLLVSCLSPSMVFSNEKNLLSVDVGKGESVWESSKTIAKSLSLRVMEFWRGWNKSVIEIRGEKVHISDVGLASPGTKVVWNKGKETFEIEGKDIGTNRDLSTILKTAMKVGKGNVWKTTRRLAKSLDMKEKEFWKAWGKSHAEIRGQKIHLSKVALVYPETKILWNHVRGAFEIMGRGIGNFKDLQVALGKRKNHGLRVVKKSITLPTKRRQVVSSSVKRSTQKKATDPLFDRDIEIQGLIMNQTKTSLGYDYYQAFVAYWVSGEKDPFTISIIEKSSPLTGVQVIVKVNDFIVHETSLRIRGQNIDTSAIKGVNETKAFVGEMRGKL